MIIAAAQTSPKRGDINENLIDHYRLIKLASDQGAELIIFPEMSLTGYEREEAAGLAFTEDDIRLNQLREISEHCNIIIVAGAPVRILDNLYIGSFIIKPDRTLELYTKHYLHPGEEVFFSSTKRYNPTISLNNKKIFLAICADIDNPKHALDAHRCGADFYMPGIFFTPSGIKSAYSTLSGCASDYSMNVLMSNFSGMSWGTEAAGKCAFWDEKGNLVAGMSSTGTGILLIEGRHNSWEGKVLYD